MPRYNGFATFSDCGTYRYELGGDIGPVEPLLVATRKVKPILWIGLNPSKAGAIKDDPTVSTAVTFSEIWGYNRFYLGNLYAFADKNPEVLARQMKRGFDVVGRPANNIYLTQMVARVRRDGGVVIAAWGGNAKLDRVREVQAIAGEMLCLRVNGDGSPTHPLYQPHDLVPTLWHGMEAA
jgi:hypothetical protein